MTGGYRQLIHISMLPSRVVVKQGDKKLYRFQAACQNPLCGALDIPAVALKVPQDAPSLNLRKHLLYPLYCHLS